MPTYYSVRSEHTLELRRGGYGKVHDAVMGLMDVPIKPLKVRFRALTNPIPVYGLPARGGLAKGILDPEDGVAQIRRKSTELGPAADNLPDTDEQLSEWLIQTLRKNSGFGSEFVEVPDADERVDGEAMDEELPQATLATPMVGVIIRNGNRAHCKVCNRSMGAQGINGHSRSKKHLANLKAYDDQIRASATG